MKVDITTNADVVAAKLRQMPGALHEALDLSVKDIADEILYESQRPWPPGVPVDKGTLKKSGHIELGELSALICYNTPYAAAVHYGTAEQDVRVRAHGRLTRIGKMIRIREHGRHMRARKARPYLANAVRAVIPKIPDMVVSRLRQAWERLRGGA